MATERKEKLIRVLQIMQTTDEKTPLNATQIVKRLDTEYELEGVERRSIYRDIALLQDCGYDIVQTEDKRSGWYMNTHAFFIMNQLMEEKLRGVFWAFLACLW